MKGVDDRGDTSAWTDSPETKKLKEEGKVSTSTLEMAKEMAKKGKEKKHSVSSSNQNTESLLEKHVKSKRDKEKDKKEKDKKDKKEKKKNKKKEKKEKKKKEKKRVKKEREKIQVKMILKKKERNKNYHPFLIGSEIWTYTKHLKRRIKSFANLNNFAVNFNQEVVQALNFSSVKCIYIIS